MASRASDGTPSSSDRRTGTGATSAAIRSISTGFFTPPPAAMISSTGGPSASHWRMPSRHGPGDELGERGHQVGVEAAVTRDGAVDERVAVHLEPVDFGGRRARNGSCSSSSASSASSTRPDRANLPVAIAGQCPAGEPPRQPVQRRVGRARVEPEDPRRVVVEHGEIGDPAQVQDRPAATGLARSVSGRTARCRRSARAARPRRRPRRRGRGSRRST